MRDILKRLEHKIQSAASSATIVSDWKKCGQKVVFTNGCFDILHKGHVTYLAKAAELGDKLVVGLNTDASVKRLGKGEERPVNSQDARAAVMASLEFVDLVVIFDEDTPLDLIRHLRPDVLAKGADYDPEELNPSAKTYIQGSKEVKEWGGSVAAIPLVAGFSTTGIIHKLKKD